MSTVPASTRSTVITLASDSAGPFDLDFRLFDTDRIQVFVNYVKVNDWTLSATFSDGYDDDATLTFDTAQSNGDRIEVLSDLVPDRDTDYQDGPLLTSLLNIELARIWSKLQDHDRDISRSLRTFGETDPGNIGVGAVPERTATGWREGPTTSDLTDAASNAAAAATSAAEAAVSAAAAATYDPSVHLRKDQNLSDLASMATAKANLGLSNAVTGTAGTDGAVPAWDSGELGTEYVVLDEDDMASDRDDALVTQQSVKAFQKLSSEYQSTGQTMVAGGLLTLAHGLGGNPKIIRLYAKCTSAQEGYSIGDNLDISASHARGRNVSDSRSFAVTFDGTNIYVRNGTSSEFMNGLNKSTGSGTGLSRANWDLYVEAWA